MLRPCIRMRPGGRYTSLARPLVDPITAVNRDESGELAPVVVDPTGGRTHPMLGIELSGLNGGKYRSMHFLMQPQVNSALAVGSTVDVRICAFLRRTD